MYAPYYFRIATDAIKEMYRQVGDYELDENGLLKKGVVIRHLILPGMLDNSKRVIDWVANTFKPGQVMFSLMHQYVPCGRAAEYPEINRKVTDEEYAEGVKNFASDYSVTEEELVERYTETRIKSVLQWNKLMDAIYSWSNVTIKTES